MLKKKFKEICRNGTIQGAEHITKITGLVIDVVAEGEDGHSFKLISSFNNITREQHKDVVHYYMRPNYTSWVGLGSIEELIMEALKLEKPKTKVQIIFPLIFVLIDISQLEEVFKDDANNGE